MVGRWRACLDYIGPMSASPPTSGPSSDLRTFLGNWFASSGGRVPFEAYMAAALYHPTHGYYTKHIATVGGHRGDFATSATLSEWLGKAIAAWIKAEVELRGSALKDSHGRIHVIEIGPGSGILARSVAKGAGWWFRRSLRFHFVEVSPVLRQEQRTLDPSAAWHDSVAEALQSCGGRAIIYSNELFDAFPVVLLRWNLPMGIWEEVYVMLSPERGVREEFVPLEESRPGFLVPESFRREWPDGQRVEIHAAWEPWLADWQSGLKCASMLSIDYGARGESLYQRRPGGTLRAFFKHQRNTGSSIYKLFGRQDMTADVDFHCLQELGESFGWETVASETQASFLERLAPGAVAAGRESAFIAQPGGAGEAFLVLSQRFGECA